MKLTPAQVGAIHVRITGTCRTIEVRPWTTTSDYIEVSQFDGARLIETVKIAPAGRVTVLS